MCPKFYMKFNHQNNNAMKKNVTKTMTVVSLMAVLMFAAGCKKPAAIKVPMVNMLENSAAIGFNNAVLYAEVTDNGGSAVTERGFCYGKDGSRMDTLFCDAASTSFSVELTNLWPMTAYTCRAFATNEAGRGFSAEFHFNTESDSVPMPLTYDVREVTYMSAIASGQVYGCASQTVLECGICFGTNEMPTIDDARVAAESVEGPFECKLEGLQPETRYYYRTYALCTKGVYYGGQRDFCAEASPMEVRTIGFSDVTASRCKAEGEVVYDGGLEILECGFCWGTEHLPTIEGVHIKAIASMGFSCYFSGLERGQTNYVRAYAINEKGVTYGNELELVPDDLSTSWSEGTLPGLFSVSPDHQVRFSQGNLQYYPDENIWRFAEHQWDFVGGRLGDPDFGTVNVGTVYANGVMCDNTQMWKYYEGWMDLFGWGTSGWNNGNEYYRPYDRAACEYHCASYGPYGNFNLTGDYAEADWGIHNTISNGGSRQWHTPSREEFVYMISERETPSGIRFAKAVVTGVSGMILLPDDWDASIYPLNAVNEHGLFAVNRITGDEWLEVLEPAGAVFFPAGGERCQDPLSNDIIYDNVMYNADMSLINGSYWTTTQSGVCIAYALVICNYELGEPYFEAGCIGVEAFRHCGRSVRLISDVR